MENSEETVPVVQPEQQEVQDVSIHSQNDNSKADLVQAAEAENPPSVEVQLDETSPLQ